MSQQEYEGRLSTDGNGNLLAHDVVVLGTKTVPVFDAAGNPVYVAGEQVTIQVQDVQHGPNHDVPVAAAEGGKYVVVRPGEPSHNARHHLQNIDMVATQSQDPELPGYADPDDPSDDVAHHFGALPDDPHYSEGATDERGNITNTAAILDPDIIAERITGHTDAYKEVG